LKKPHAAIPALSALILLALLASAASADVGPISLQFSKDDLTFSKDSGFDKVTIRGGGLTGSPGEPQMPSVGISVALPRGCAATDVEVAYSNPIEFFGRYRMWPAQRPQPLSAQNIPSRFISPDAKVYRQTSPYPGKLCDLTTSGSLAGHSVASVEVFPLQYIPAKGKLILYTEIELSLKVEPKQMLPVHKRSSLGEEFFSDYVRELVINPDDVLDSVAENVVSPLDPDVTEYLIITSSALAADFEPLRDWKTKKGVPAEIRTTDWVYSNYAGEDNQAKIRNCIKDYYQNHGLVHILLGGDADTVPFRPAYAMSGSEGYNIPCDLYFNDLDGSWNNDGDGYYGEYPSDGIDMYADCILGRACVDTSAETDLFVSKVLQYEGEESMPDLPRDFQLEVLMLGSYLDGSTDMGRLKDLVDTDCIPARFNVTKLYQRTGNLNWSSAIAALNEGPNMVNHGGHGWEDSVQAGNDYIYDTDMYGLTNGPRYTGFFYSTSCYSLHFPYLDCFGEKFALAPNGGGNYIGNTHYGWYLSGQPTEGLSQSLDYEFWDGLFNHQMYHLGAAHAYAKDARVYAATGGSDWPEYERYCLYEVTLMGDPELPLWTNTPGDLAVNHPATLPTGPSAFTVTVTDSGPVSDALVTLWKGDEVYSRGLTDASGTVTLYPDPATEGTMFVTCTKHDYIPYEGEAEVTGAATVLPEDYSIVRGIWVSGDLEDLCESDDSRLVVQAGPTMDPTESPVWVMVEGTSPVSAPSELRFTLEARANTTGLRQRIELYNYLTESWEEVDTRAATTTDSVVVVAVSGDPSRFIEPGTLSMKAQLTWKNTAPVMLWPFAVGIDHTVWSVAE
jgi:hypothetical protein